MSEELALFLTRSGKDDFQIEELPRNSKAPRIIRRCPTGLKRGDEIFIEMESTQGRGKFRVDWGAFKHKDIIRTKEQKERIEKENYGPLTRVLRKVIGL